MLTSTVAAVDEVESWTTQSQLSSAAPSPAPQTDDADAVMKSTRAAQSTAADTELRRRKPKTSGYPLVH